MYSAEEILVANRTCRGSGASAIKDGKIRAVVPKYIEEHIDHSKNILDFGAGKDALHTKYLSSKGFNVTAYDFGSNCIPGVHDAHATEREYDIVFASNVINVSSNKEMMINTLNEIKNCLSDNGEAIFNYPESPRKAGLKTADVIDVVKSVFDNVSIVGGTKNAPILMVN